LLLVDFLDLPVDLLLLRLEFLDSCHGKKRGKRALCVTAEDGWSCRVFGVLLD
jgi:hypothetical protein